MMKKIISLIFIAVVISSILFSCGKEKTTTIYETVYVRDTIVNMDTLFIIDSVFTIDTVVIIDTVIIYDTSEFSYLFKHHELEEYEILFYTLDKQKSPHRICRMNSNSHDISIIEEGYNTYPVWAEEENFIYYIDVESAAVIKKDISDNPMPDSIIFLIDRNVQFLWHHTELEVFLFSYYFNDIVKIAAIDYKNGEIVELTDFGEQECNPVSSRVDDWIYYSLFRNGTWDIYRKKIDGSSVEMVYEDPNFNLRTFNVSYDGKFLITPKYNNGKGLVVFYDIRRHTIIHELELPVDGHPLYASLSDDNKAIFFVNGTPFNYTVPRNIYRMALDRTQLFQLTQFENHLASRPLVK